MIETDAYGGTDGGLSTPYRAANRCDAVFRKIRNVRIADNIPAIRVLSSVGEVCGPMRLNPEQLAVRYYYDVYSIEGFRELLSTLEEGYDGP